MSSLIWHCHLQALSKTIVYFKVNNSIQANNSTISITLFFYIYILLSGTILLFDFKFFFSVLTVLFLVIIYWSYSSFLGTLMTKLTAITNKIITREKVIHTHSLYCVLLKINQSFFIDFSNDTANTYELHKCVYDQLCKTHAHMELLY